VDSAGAGVVGDEKSVDDLRRARQEGMLSFATQEIFAFELRGRLSGIQLETGAGAEGLNTGVREDELFTAAIFMGEGGGGVVEVRMQSDAEIGRQGPGRGGPDDEVIAIRQSKLHIDRRRGLFFILHLGFREGGLGAVAPEDGALGTIDEAFFQELRKGAHDVGLIGRREREVGVLPVAEDAEALEGLALDVDELAGVGFRARADFGRGEVLGFLHDFELDGQAVAIPAGDVGSVEAGHGLGLHDEVLEHFVQRGAHVDVAIGKGRAVMQDELRASGGLLHDALIKAARFPFGQALGLASHEIRLHGEVGLRQADGVFVVLLGRGLGAHDGKWSLETSAAERRSKESVWAVRSENESKGLKTRKPERYSRLLPFLRHEHLRHLFPPPFYR
jgi:hypothetical protein